MLHLLSNEKQTFMQQKSCLKKFDNNKFFKYHINYFEVHICKSCNKNKTQT